MGKILLWPNDFIYETKQVTKSSALLKYNY